MQGKKLFQFHYSVGATAFVIVCQIFFGSVTARAAYVGDKYITSAGACVMDCDTGEILYELNGSAARVPASMTKIMTMYCVYEAVANGEIALDTAVPISSNVYYKSRNQLYQNMIPLSRDVTYTVDELMGVVVTYSASGATVALAELVGGGSEAAFVKRMNDTAVKMGINARYYDSCGVADNQISPVAMASLAKNIINTYPDILVRSAKKSVTLKGGTYKTTNHLLDTYYYEGADGLKTGTGTAAGACFCGTAVRDGKRIISVTMGSASASSRFTDTAKLLDYGFSVIDDRINTIYYTNMRTFVEDREMPTFSYRGAVPHAVVIAEDLANYGFDVVYDDSSRALRISLNREKAVNPILLDIYRNKNGEKAFKIMPSDISVVLFDGAREYVLKDVYNVGGYMCVSVDEFAGVFDFSWNSDELSAYIEF